MRDLRAHKRIPCDALGYLILGEVKLGVQTLNVSREGACLQVGDQTWISIEEIDVIQGALNLGGETFRFKARVCWSAGDGNAHVAFGIQFIESDQKIMEAVLQSASIVDEGESLDSFNL